MGKKACAKIVLFDRHAVEKWGSGGLPQEKFFEATPARPSENAIFAKWKIVVFIINLHAEEEKLAVDKLILCMQPR